MGVLQRQPGELYCPTCEQTFSDGDRCPTDNTRLVRISTPVDTLIGRELDGRYTIVEKLGQGGMGAVYRGTQHSVGREVAIKVVAPGLVSDGAVIKRFLREAKLASRLVHPNAVAVLDFGQTEDGLFYLVMELVDGRTLDDVIAAGNMSPTRLVRIGMQICDALEGAHALKIVHRDLKPQNVMVMNTGRDLVKVLDFGIAKSLTPDHKTTTMTNAGALLGTPAYMPPELVGGQPVDARADLYSLGCVLFVAATGRLPFEATTVTELIAMHACEPAPPVTGVPPRLAAVIGRLLEKEPDERFQSAAKTRDALEASIAAEAFDSSPAIPVAEEEDQSTKLGWSGHHTAFAKGQRTRVGTPVSGVKPVKPVTPAPSAMLASTVPRDQQEAFASLPTLPVDSLAQQLAVTPVPPPPTRKSRTGLLVTLGAVVAAAGVVTFLALRSPSATENATATPTEPTKQPAKVEPAKVEPAKVEPAKVEPAKVEPTAPAEPTPTTKTPDPATPPVPTPTPTPAKPDPKLTTPIPSPPNGAQRVGTEGAPNGARQPPPAKTTPKTTPPLKREPPKVEKKEEPPVRAPITRNPGVM